MAKPRLSRLAAALCGVLAAPASHADWKVRPQFELRELYSDNVSLGADAERDEKQGMWVTELNPGLEVEHRGRRLTVKTSAALNYFIYGDERVEGTKRFHKQFNGSANAELLEDHLFVEARGSIAPRNVSPFGPPASASRYAAANQAEVTSTSIAPIWVQRFGNSASMQLRYMRDRVDAGESGFGSSDGNSYTFDLTSGPAYRSFSWNLHATRRDIESFRGRRVAASAEPQRTITDTALASVGYALSSTFSLTATGGYDKYDYALGGASEGASWSTGFIWTPSTRTSVRAAIGKHFVGGNDSFEALHRTRRTVWRIGYDESVSNTRFGFMLPATFDTAGLLDRMFAAQYPDALEREREVAEYMRENGLPPVLIDNINFLSNRFFLQKQLTASVGAKLPRTDISFALYRTRRDALTDSQTDSAVLGQATSSLNSNTKQIGARLSLNYRISPRSDLRISQNLYDNTSLSAGGRQTVNRATRLSFSRQLGRHLVAGAELRRQSGTSAARNYAPYREHAIAASLTYQR